MKNAITRMQRLRQGPVIRNMLSETHLRVEDFVMPIFVHELLSEPQAIESLPGISQLDLGSVLEEVEFCAQQGVKSFMLFGIPSQKDLSGELAYDENGIVQKTIRLIKDNYPDVLVMVDCCLCEYTCHGNCGILDNGCLNNDATLDVLAKIALSYAEAGADVIAPSGMMDGMVLAIRNALDQSGYVRTLILSYSTKYASAFYGPFRDAAGVDSFEGTRDHHQLNPTQRREGIRETLIDVSEGADMVMVKPAGAYLDVIRDIRERVELPLAAYQVSGEYSLLKLGVAKGLISEAAIIESLMAIKRSGADIIISYFARDIARILKN